MPGDLSSPSPPSMADDPLPPVAPPANKPLPPPPPLPFPSLAALRALEPPDLELVDLDERSWEHVERLARQSLANMKVRTEWVVSRRRRLFAGAQSVNVTMWGAGREAPWRCIRLRCGCREGSEGALARWRVARRLEDGSLTPLRRRSWLIGVTELGRLDGS